MLESFKKDNKGLTAGFAVVYPVEKIQGILRVPGDKSISHRLAMMGGMVDGEWNIYNFLASDDCLRTLEAVRLLGGEVNLKNTTVRIKGTGGKYKTPLDVLDMGNSGTGMRLLCGLLAAHEFESILTGDESLSRRPMLRIAEPLRLMGAEVELLTEGKYAPIKIRGSKLKGINYKLSVASAQVKSCILLAGMFAQGMTTISGKIRSRDHTERLLKKIGVPVYIKDDVMAISGSGGENIKIAPAVWSVPGDFSSAAFWIVAGACGLANIVKVCGVGLNPYRVGLIEVLKKMGVKIEVKYYKYDEWEPVGDVIVKGSRMKAVEIGGDIIPEIIDEIPAFSIAASFADGKTVIKDAHELRVKESDRIATIYQMLSKLGVSVEEREDGMVIYGPASFKGGVEIDSKGDHRIAMSAAIAGLFCKEPVRVKGINCIKTSYATFWEDFEKLAGNRFEIYETHNSN